MNSERFKKIKELLLEVADLPEDERITHLDRACGDDLELRKEIEAYLAHDDDRHDILRPVEPIPESFGDLIQEESIDRMIGKQISHYRILEKIGQGGMGVVYRAEDTRLQRTVALKFLPQEYRSNPDIKTRFVKEAKTAAALNHPNICTVYEIGESGDQTFIAMAFVDGESIREVISRGPLKLNDVLHIAIQAGEGIRTAHDQGIVHRDIKPSNIMMTGNGQVVIMDFGIARSIEQTRITKTGMAVGTVAYMSPEQARGEEVNRRTDIWSMGVSIYEMITGITPFQRENDQAAIFAIQHEEPEPPTALRSRVPMELERIVLKCLEKDPDYRYQTADDLVADLRRLEDTLTTSTVPYRTTGRQIPIPRRKWPVWVKVVSLLVLIVTVGIFTPRYLEIRDQPLQIRQSIQVTSAISWEGEPDISPDGGRIAFTSNRSGNLDIYLIDSHGGQPLQITDNPTSDHSPSWYPDGSSIVFVSDRTGIASIWKTGQLGGDPILLLPNADQPAVSPDGSRLAFTRVNDEGYQRIGVAPLSDLSEARILTGEEDGLWNHRSPAWSPDGKEICYAAQENLWSVTLKDGHTRPITTDGNYHLHPAWSPDGRHLFFSSEREGTLALWSVSARGGEPKRLTTGSGSEGHPSISANGSYLAYATEFVDHDIALLDTRTGREWKVAGPKYESMPTFLPDKSGLVFVSDRQDSRVELWFQPISPDGDQAAPRRLTDHPGTSSHPAISPDGRWVAYYRILEEQRDIWTVSMSGGPSNQLTTHEAPDYHPTWSPDGSRIAFVSDRSGQPQIWTVEIDNGKRAGDPTQLTGGDLKPLTPAWSPDGSQIAFVGYRGSDFDVWSIPVDSGSPPRQVTRGAYPIRIRWDSTGSTLFVSGYWQNEQPCLRTVDAETGDIISPVKEVDFGWMSIECLFDISRDRELIAYTKKETNGDIWLIEAE